MKPQDIIVAAKLLISDGKKGSFAEMGKTIGLSASEVHAAVQRLKDSYLLDSYTGHIRKSALKEFMVHGLQYSFPVSPGKPARGLLTGFSSPFFKDEFEINKSTEVYVWPYSLANNRGISVEPLYRTVPEICAEDPILYNWLAVLDMLRMNRARERDVALKKLENLFNNS